MSKLRMFPLRTSYYPFGEFYDPSLGRHGGNFAEFEELNDDGDILQIKGQDLVYDDGVLVDGIITSMMLFNSQGGKYCTMTDFELDVSDLPIYQPYWAAYVAAAVFDSGNDRMSGSFGIDAFEGSSGRDVIFGRQGDDYIDGGRGSDTLSGGAGADAFFMSAGDGRDLITDFQPGMDELHGGGTWVARKANRGQDTLIEFDNGCSALLEDIGKGELQGGDILF